MRLNISNSLKFKKSARLYKKTTDVIATRHTNAALYNRQYNSEIEMSIFFKNNLPKILSSRIHEKSEYPYKKKPDIDSTKADKAQGFVHEDPRLASANTQDKPVNTCEGITQKCFGKSFALNAVTTKYMV